MSIKESLIAWADQFDHDHYVFDMYGEEVTVDLPRETVEKVMDISILLVDRVVSAQDDLTTAEYEQLEENVRKKYPEDGTWLLHVVMEVLDNDHLFGRYKDIEPMIGKLMPRGYPTKTAAYLIMVRPEILELIYAVIRHVDDVRENYESLVFTCFAGILTKGWGEGFGWYRTENGSWAWHNRKYDDEQNQCDGGLQE